MEYKGAIFAEDKVVLYQQRKECKRGYYQRKHKKAKEERKAKAGPDNGTGSVRGGPCA